MASDIFVFIRCFFLYISLQWRHNGRDSVSNHQPQDWFLNRLSSRRSKKTSKLRVTGLFAGNSPVTGECPAQMVSNAENVSIWWRHHLQWCRMAMVSQITGKSSVCSFLSWLTSQKHQRSSLLVFGKGSPSQNTRNAESASVSWRHHRSV